MSTSSDRGSTPEADPGSGATGDRSGPTAPPSSSEEAHRRHDDDPLRGSRTSGIWVATVGLGLLLVLLIIFIAQNTQTTTVNFLGLSAEAPVAVALLIATAAGILLTATAGTLRIWQLRRRTRKGLKAGR